MFEEHCKMMYEKHGNTNDAVMVFSDSIEVRKSIGKHDPFFNKKNFRETCGEDNINCQKEKGEWILC